MKKADAQPPVIDWDKVADMALALMHLTTFEEHGTIRSWKGYDWDVLDRLRERGLIASGPSAAKSVVLTEEARELSRELFERHFVKATQDTRS